jgi:serine/threonine-protein kinase
MDKPPDPGPPFQRGEETQALAESSGPTAERAREAGQAPGAAPSSWGSLIKLRQIGAGAFGEVFEAWDPLLERSVALKLLGEKPGHGAPAWDAALREGRLLARIRHPSVVQVFGVDLIDGRVGIWMELVQGTTLEKWITRHGPLSAREALGIGIELCRALAAIHASGLVHGDVKSQNVMREEGGRIVLMDLGLGRAAAAAKAAGESSRGGTPLYMSPELLGGGPPGTASDIYALGVLLFHLVTGRFPVTGSTLRELRARISTGQVDSLRDIRPDIPAHFSTIVERATARDPAGRFPSAGQMERAILAALGAGETAGAPLAASGREAGRPVERPGKRGPGSRRLHVRTWTAACLLLFAAVIFMWIR